MLLARLRSGFLVAALSLGLTLGCANGADDELFAAGGSKPVVAIGGSKHASGGSSGGGGLSNGGSFPTISGGSGGSGSNGCSSSAGTSPGGTGGTTPEQCGNGLDDDGNGFVDEGCKCVIGTTQPCYGGPSSLAGKGACAKGTQTCSGTEFGLWGPCKGWTAPSLEVCEGAIDEDCDGVIDQACGCCEGETQPCGVAQGACTPGTQTCVGGKWGECTGGTPAIPEICGNQIDDDCDGQVDQGCTLEIDVNIDGDCVTASCPPQAPHAVGCQIAMSGGDDRGCIANNGGPVVYFQEGNNCGAGHVSGTLTCSSQPGAPLGPSNCPINKNTKYYPSDPGGCPAT